MENFKGTSGDWSADIGADIDRNGMHTVIVFSNKSPMHVANAFGNNYDEAMANAKIISQAKNAVAAMQKFCARVEAGEVRSKKTYAEFKQIIEDAL